MGFFSWKKEEPVVKETKGFGLLKFLSGRTLSDEFFEEFEDVMVEGDMGVKTAIEISSELKRRLKAQRQQDEQTAHQLLREILVQSLCTTSLEPEEGVLNIYLVLGVNGVGKTTSIAKMAHFFEKRLGKQRILLAAGDTFRAAAIDQLVVHGERLGVRVVRHSPGADPGAVIFDAIDSAQARKMDVILADTAGRMHTKSHLIEELKKINKIVSTKGGNSLLRKVLVIDATTGQNSLSQVEVFHEAVGLDGIILTKYDSLSKGGNLFTICRQHKIPIAFVGVGEGYEDFLPFDPEQFVERFLGE